MALNIGSDTKSLLMTRRGTTDGLSRIFWVIFPSRVKILFHVRGEVRLKETSEKVEIAVWLQMTFGDHLWSAIILLAILDGSHYQKS